MLNDLRRAEMAKRSIARCERKPTDMLAMFDRLNALRAVAGLPKLKRQASKYTGAMLREIRARPVNFLGAVQR